MQMWFQITHRSEMQSSQLLVVVGTLGRAVVMVPVICSSNIIHRQYNTLITPHFTRTKI